MPKEIAKILYNEYERDYYGKYNGIELIKYVYTKHYRPKYERYEWIKRINE